MRSAPAPEKGAGLWTHSVPRIMRCAPEGAALCVRGPCMHLRTGNRSGGEKHGRDKSRLPACHAPLAAASFAGAVVFAKAPKSGRTALEYLPGDLCSRSIVEVGKRHPRSIPLIVWSSLAHMGTREHTLPREFGTYHSDFIVKFCFGRNQPVCE